MTMPGHKVTPDDYMPVLDFCEPRIYIPLPCVRFGAGENAIQIRRIRLILPMMLERMNVRLGACTRFRIHRRCHVSNMSVTGFFRHRATIGGDHVVIRRKSHRSMETTMRGIISVVTGAAL